MRELARAAREFLEREAPVSAARAQMKDRRAFDRALWARLAEMGWLGVVVPELNGGLGLGMVDGAALCHEMGRVLFTGPFLTTAIVAPFLVESDVRTDLASGLVHPTFADEQVVADAPSATHLVRTDGDEVFIANRADASVHPQPCIDLTRRVGTVEPFVGASIGGADVERARDAMRIGLSAEAVGAAERCLELAVAYAKERIQFDKPIGSFQAIQHLLADTLRAVELARAATEEAAERFDARDPLAHRWALVAKAKTGEACVRAVADALQVHGGIGYTWEHDIHLYYRRVRANAALMGTPAWCRDRLTDSLL